MVYTILKTPAKYNVKGIDTYSVLYKNKVKLPMSSQSCQSWLMAIDKSFLTLEDAEKELNNIMKPHDKFQYNACGGFED